MKRTHMGDGFYKFTELYGQFVAVQGIGLTDEPIPLKGGFKDKPEREYQARVWKLDGDGAEFMGLSLMLSGPVARAVKASAPIAVVGKLAKASTDNYEDGAFFYKVVQDDEADRLFDLYLDDES